MMELWEVNKKPFERPTKFKTAEELWDACSSYFRWCEENPIYRQEVTRTKDGTKLTKIPLTRPFTFSGLCVFLNIGENYWRQLRKSKKNREDEAYSLVTAQVDRIMRTQKFDGAAVGNFKENLIAREIGLADKSAHEFPGVEKATINVRRNNDKPEGKS